MSLEIYTQGDMKLIKENLDGISRKAKKRSFEILEPSADTMKKMMDVILKYIKDIPVI